MVVLIKSDNQIYSFFVEDGKSLYCIQDGLNIELSLQLIFESEVEIISDIRDVNITISQDNLYICYDLNVNFDYYISIDTKNKKVERSITSFKNQYNTLLVSMKNIGVLFKKINSFYCLDDILKNILMCKLKERKITTRYIHYRYNRIIIALNDDIYFAVISDSRYNIAPIIPTDNILDVFYQLDKLDDRNDPERKILLHNYNLTEYQDLNELLSKNKLVEKYEYGFSGNSNLCDIGYHIKDIDINLYTIYDNNICKLYYHNISPVSSYIPLTDDLKNKLREISKNKLLIDAQYANTILFMCE